MTLWTQLCIQKSQLVHLSTGNLLSVQCHLFDIPWIIRQL